MYIDSNLGICRPSPSIPDTAEFVITEPVTIKMRGIRTVFPPMSFIYRGCKSFSDSPQWVEGVYLDSTPVVISHKPFTERFTAYLKPLVDVKPVYTFVQLLGEVEVSLSKERPPEGIAVLGLEDFVLLSVKPRNNVMEVYGDVPSIGEGALRALWNVVVKSLPISWD